MTESSFLKLNLLKPYLILMLNGKELVLSYIESQFSEIFSYKFFIK